MVFYLFILVFDIISFGLYCKLSLFWLIKHCFRVCFSVRLVLVDYQIWLIGLQSKRGLLRLFRGVYISLMVVSFSSYDDLNKHDFSFVLHVVNNLSLQGKRLYINLSKINWIRCVIRILQVLRYNVIFESKFFFNIFGFQVQCYLWVRVSKLIFSFLGLVFNFVMNCMTI